MLNTDKMIDRLLGSEDDQQSFEGLVDVIGENTNTFSFEFLFKNFIKDQITFYLTRNTITDKPKNYLREIKNKVDFIIEYNPMDTERIENVKKAYSELLLQAYEIMENVYEISNNGEVDDIEDLPLKELEEVVMAFYTFIVISRYDNLVEFLSNYIFQNRKSLLENYTVPSSASSMKNLSISGYKKTYKDFNDAYLIYILDQIILDILSTYEVSNEVFQEYLEERAGLYFNAIYFRITEPKDPTLIAQCMKFFVDNKFALTQLTYDVKVKLSTQLPKR